jgi:hemoglobin
MIYDGFLLWFVYAFADYPLEQITLTRPAKTSTQKINITFRQMIVLKHDILNREDVKILVDRFYDKAKDDALLGPAFSNVDWPHHLPIMYDFWSSMLLGDQTYRGNPLQKHMHLAINEDHFNRWLLLFTQTVDEHFQGEKAEEVKMRAQSIAGIFQLKMGITKFEDT